MASLAVKDNNYVNYAALTIGFYYFSKQMESLLINRFKKMTPSVILFDDAVNPKD